MSPDELAQIAYDAYGATTDHKNFRGDPMPVWDDLPSNIRRAWMSASSAVAAAVIRVAVPSHAVPLPAHVTKECCHCGFLLPPGLSSTRCPSCQQVYDG